MESEHMPPVRLCFPLSVKKEGAFTPTRKETFKTNSGSPGETGNTSVRSIASIPGGARDNDGLNTRIRGGCGRENSLVSVTV